MANKFYTYGFGLMIGLMALASKGYAQQKPKTDMTHQKKEVILGDDLREKLTETFVRDTVSQNLWQEKVLYYPDSANVEAPNVYGLKFNTMFKIRVGDHEEVMLTAQDNGDRIITEDELNFVVDYTASPRGVERLSSYKFAQNRYSVARAYTKALHDKGQAEFNCELYGDNVTWRPDLKLSPKFTETILEVFNEVKDQRPPTKKSRKERKLERQLEELGY